MQRDCSILMNSGAISCKLCTWVTAAETKHHSRGKWETKPRLTIDAHLRDMCNTHVSTVWLTCGGCESVHGVSCDLLATLLHTCGKCVKNQKWAPAACQSAALSLPPLSIDSPLNGANVHSYSGLYGRLPSPSSRFLVSPPLQMVAHVRIQ